MRGRKPVSEQRQIQIHYPKFKTKRHVSFLSHVARLNSDFQFTYSSMEFLTDMKMKIKPAVDSSYEFNTSKTLDSIGHNASRAEALLSKATFIYRVCLSSHRICSQLSTAICFTGVQLRRASTLSISTPHNPESCQYHVVPGQGRHRHCLS